MNIERIINMILRQLMRRGVNKGIDMALGSMSKKHDDGPEQKQMSKEARQKMKSARRLF